MREVEQRIAALLGDTEEQQQATGSSGVQSPPPPPQQQQRVPARPVAAAALLQQQQGVAAPAAAAAVTGRTPCAPAGELRLVSAGVSFPHPAKAATGGEDAFLVSGWGRGAVAVADGVGGWAAEGIDPSLYPRRLVVACEEALEAGVAAGPEACEGGAALAVLEAARAITFEPGSCTVIVVLLLPGGRLSVANLGDTSLRVVRGGRVVHSTQASSRLAYGFESC